VCWDDKNGFGERVWMGLEIESVEKALWMMTRVGVISADTNTIFDVYTLA
jgi:hypothetical protein